MKHLSTKEQVRNLIDALITPELACTEAKQLAKLLAMASDVDGDQEKAELTAFARRYAFTKTVEFESAFKNWAGENSEILQEMEKVSDGSLSVH